MAAARRWWLRSAASRRPRTEKPLSIGFLRRRHEGLSRSSPGAEGSRSYPLPGLQGARSRTANRSADLIGRKLCADWSSCCF
jgi:hypothetical protein